MLRKTMSLLLGIAFFELVLFRLKISSYLTSKSPSYLDLGLNPVLAEEVSTNKKLAGKISPFCSLYRSEDISFLKICRKPNSKPKSQDNAF
jgi:hypothetical protein